MAPPSSTLRTLGLALLVAFAALAGCADDEDDQATEQVQQAEKCQTETSSDDHSSGGQIACRNAVGPDTHGRAFPCEDPSRSAVSLAGDLASGSITVKVRDDNETVVFQETYGSEDGLDDSQDIDEGAAGEWTLIVARSETMEGDFGVRAACGR